MGQHIHSLAHCKLTEMLLVVDDLHFAKFQKLSIKTVSSDLLHQPLLALYFLLSTDQIFNQPLCIFTLGSLVAMPAVQKPKSYKQPKPRTTDDISEAGPSRPKPRPIEQRDASGIPGVSKLKGQIRQTTRLLAKVSPVLPLPRRREEQRRELD